MNHDVSSFDASGKDGLESVVRALVLAPYLRLVGVPQPVLLRVIDEFLRIEGSVSDWLQLSRRYLACRVVLRHSAWGFDEFRLLLFTFFPL